MFYGLLLLSICAGLAECVGAFTSRRRDHRILVASLSATLIGSWVNYRYQFVQWKATTEAIWFTILGVAPIALGGISLFRWLQLKS